MSDRKVQIKDSGLVGYLVYAEEGYYEIELSNGNTVSFEDENAFEDYVEPAKPEPRVSVKSDDVRDGWVREEQVINGYTFPASLVLYSSILAKGAQQALKPVGGDATLWPDLTDEQKWNYITVALGETSEALKEKLDSGKLSQTMMEMMALHSLGTAFMKLGRMK